MEQNTVPPVEANDTAALAQALHKIEFMSPDPAWNEGETGWARIARTGAVAAEQGDMRGAKASCKGCHSQWRDQYREAHRPRPLPEMPANAAAGDPSVTL